jgi:hypothetical protein
LKDEEFPTIDVVMVWHAYILVSSVQIMYTSGE